MHADPPALRIATAGWNVPAALADRFPGDGQHLARYARVMDAVEINSSFYRSHQRTTYARWAGMVPAGFRFAVKVPRGITHEHRLRGTDALLDRFLGEIGGLEERLGPLLVQLPPSLAFDATVSAAFFEALRQRHTGPVVCEPRHASWFQAEAGSLLEALRVGRVAADPALNAAAAMPGGWLGAAGPPPGAGAILYVRLHGSPAMYRSPYGRAQLEHWRDVLAAWPGAQRWCVFDNTAEGAALPDALAFKALHTGHAAG